MSRDVTDQSVNFLRNWEFPYLVSHHAFGQMGICTTHGVFTPAHIPPLWAALPFQVSHQDFFTSRSISLHGLRVTDLPRESARHRNLSARSPSQALSLGHMLQYRQQHTGRCQRATRLSHRCGFRAEPNPDCQNPLRSRALCGGVGTGSLRTRYHNHRPVRKCLSLGALPSGPSLLRHSRPIQFWLSLRLLSFRGQIHRTVLRPDHCLDRSQGQQGLPAVPATHQVLRCRTRSGSGISSQPLRLACADHRSALSLPLAGRTIPQADQTASSYQALLRHHRECSQDTNLGPITVYVLVATVKKRLNTEASLYTILQSSSLTLFEKTTPDQFLKNTEMQMTTQQNNNQLNLFN